jgi:hypothetical protein
MTPALSRTGPRVPTPWAGAGFLGPLVLGGLLLVGCGDLETAALVSVETDSPVPTLHLGRDLPSVPTLVSRWGGILPLEEVQARWTGSWLLPPSEGDRVRSEAVQALVLLLEPRLSPEEMEAEVDRVRLALANVTLALEGRDLESLDGPVADAARAAARAGEALEAEDRAVALRWALEASDHLRRATPEVVARTLIQEVEARLEEGRISDAHPYPEEMTARAQRLLQGARAALASDDAPLALRRVWYASGVLGVVEGGEGVRGPGEPHEEGP